VARAILLDNCIKQEKWVNHSLILYELGNVVAGFPGLQCSGIAIVIALTTGKRGASSAMLTAPLQMGVSGNCPLFCHIPNITFAAETN
jgi:hypothetical protein